MALIEENYGLLSALARQAARSVHSNFPMVEYDDLANEAILWCVQHPRKLGEYLGNDDQKRRERMIVGAMRNVCKDYARKERAAQLGTDISDDAWYRHKQLREVLLPAVYDPEAWTSPPRAVVKRRGEDPAEGNNWVTMLADVSSALDKLGVPDVLYLDMRYGRGLRFRQIAEELDISIATAHSKVSSAIKRVQEALGGAKPYDDPPEDLDERIRLENLQANKEVWQNYAGSRRAITNAHARAITRADYKGD